MHTTRMAWAALIAAIGLTVVYHIFYAVFPYGLSFVVMMGALLVSVFAMQAVSGQRGNRWAYVFLGPVLLSMSAQLVYTSPAVQGIGFLVAAVSFLFLAYWLSVPRVTFQAVKTFWPKAIFFETLWPFRGFGKLIRTMSAGRREKNVLIGVALAIPFLLVFGALFMQADALFSKTLSSFFQDVNVWSWIGYVYRDIIIGLILLGSAWMFATRIMDARAPGIEEEHHLDLHETILVTSLALVNALFLLFVAFQFAYFFGGEAFRSAQDLTYADYGRGGFFQLIAVAGIVFFISYFLSTYGQLRHRIVKILSLLLILQTFVILVSAVNRLSLYIQTYGLTVSRWWAMASICIIGLTLFGFVVAILLKIEHRTYAKATCLAWLWVLSGLLLYNVEGKVVSYNAERFLSGETRVLDAGYIGSLVWGSTDAVPQVVALAKAGWPAWTATDDFLKDAQLGLATEVRTSLQTKDPAIVHDLRAFTFSNAWAWRALLELK